MISSFDWTIGQCSSLQAVLDRVRVPGVAPCISAMPPDVSDRTIRETNDFVSLDQIYPNVAPVAATVVAALRSGVSDLSAFDFVTERRCLKRIASLSHSLCTDLQMLNGTIFARDVPKHRCVNYGSVGHQFHRLCAPPVPEACATEFFHLTDLRCGPHRLLVASEVDCRTASGEGVELKIGKLGGLSTWTQCLFANVPYVVRGTSREIEPGLWSIQRVDTFSVGEMLTDEVKDQAMAMFARVLTMLKRSMREGCVYRLQREQRNIVCFELPDGAPLITRDELDWLHARVSSEQARAAPDVGAESGEARRRGSERAAGLPVDESNRMSRPSSSAKAKPPRPEDSPDDTDTPLSPKPRRERFWRERRRPPPRLARTRSERSSAAFGRADRSWAAFEVEDSLHLEESGS